MDPEARTDADARDAEWVASIRAGDQRALGALMREYTGPLLQYTTTIVGSADAAHDVVQELWVRLWSARVTLAIDGTVRAYLFRAARNRALNAARDHTARRRAHDTAVRLTSTSASVAHNVGADAADAASLRAAVRAAAHDLRPPTRDIVVLRLAYGLTPREVADVLHLSVGHVHVALSRAMRRVVDRLRKVL